MAHLSVVFFWLAFLFWNGAYYSNYWSWLKDEVNCLPSIGRVWSIVGQDILNSDVGGFQFSGMYTCSGLFQLWRAQGFVSVLGLKYGLLASLFGSIINLIASFLSMHLSLPHIAYYKKYRSIAGHKLAILYGLGSISWSGHLFHVSAPINTLLDLGIDISYIPKPSYMFTRLWINMASTSNFSPDSIYGPKASIFNHQTGGIFNEAVIQHHLFLGISLILGSFIYHYQLLSRREVRSIHPHLSSSGILGSSWHGQLAINLGLLASCSIFYASLISFSLVAYPFCSSDYPTMTCLFTHHQWIGGFLIVGAGTHASISLIRDYNSFETFGRASIGIEIILAHRDILVSHLIWSCVSLGLHSYGLFIHNDTMQALCRPQDVFADSSIGLKPIFGIFVSRLFSSDIEVIGSKVVRTPVDLGSSDFLVYHIHAFTIHTTVLILVKGLLFSRSSRLISDKFILGVTYPCDGPGRGGTCQISPWDHTFLAVFWMYNSLSIVIFHYFWKMQSDVWGRYNLQEAVENKSPVGGVIAHIQPDFSVNAVTINGWLRNFLWSGSAQVLQSYGTSLAGYGIIFLLAHFLWAFSLMFLFSGRGYWQELIEAITWAHHKLWLTPRIQPRALSITHGRASGLAHFILGGIGTTWSFLIARIISVSSHL